MDSYQIDECASRIDDHFSQYNLDSSTCQSRRQALQSSTLGPRHKRFLELDLAQKTKRKNDEAAAGLNTQIELLQLLKGTTDIPPHVEEALNRTFPGDDIAELRKQYELDRDSLINPGTSSTEPTTRQTRSQTRIAKRSIVETTPEDVTKALLDTPVVKKSRHNAQKPAIPTTPAPLPPRRSSRLTTVPKVNFAETAFVAAEGSEYEDGEEAEAVDEGGADTLPGDDTSLLAGSDDTQIVVEKHFRDARGFTRIGPQPKAPAIYAKWAPEKGLSTKLREKVAMLFNNTDKKIKTQRPEEYSADIAAVHHKVMESLSPYDGDKFTHVCDYTGTNISFAPGPRSLSFEAIYPFIVVNGQITYHTA